MIAHDKKHRYTQGEKVGVSNVRLYLIKKIFDNKMK